MLKEIQVNINGLHAEALATHLLIVMKNVISGKPEGSIPEDALSILNQMDQAYLKLKALSEKQDDESLNSLFLTVPEAEAIIQAFINKEFKTAALQDPFYQKRSYSDYLQQVFSRYLKDISGGYVLALAA